MKSSNSLLHSHNKYIRNDSVPAQININQVQVTKKKSSNGILITTYRVLTELVLTTHLSGGAELVPKLALSCLVSLVWNSRIQSVYSCCFKWNSRKLQNLCVFYTYRVWIWECQFQGKHNIFFILGNMNF